MTTDQYEHWSDPFGVNHHVGAYLLFQLKLASISIEPDLQ